MFHNKKIFILGMARSGYHAARVLSKDNIVTITDMKEQDESKVKELESLGVKFILSNEPEDILDNTYDVVVKNPGIKIDHKVILKAKELNIPVTNEVEVAYNLFPKNINIIAISGSNGKTTTTTMIYEVLKKAGVSVYLGGNIGYPVCSLVDEIKEGDTVVLEISSQQLNDTITFNPNIGILTNLCSVHLDHFGSFDYYIKVKEKLLLNQSNNDYAILNMDDVNVYNMKDDIISNKEYFSINNNKANIYLKDNYIIYNNEEVIDIRDIKLKGNHNYMNIMCMIAAVKKLNVNNNIIIEYLKEFNGVEHRLEYVKEIDGVKYYNDSKATNVESTIIAIDSFKSDVILLLGGLDRKHSFDKLYSHMDKVKLVVSFGETSERIYNEFKLNNINVIKCNTLREATIKAMEESIKGDVILLSPACASWDAYSSFEERGKEFKNIINERD